MKKIIRLMCFVTLIYLILAGAAYFLVDRHFTKEAGMRNVVMNRIVKDYREGDISLNLMDKMEEYRGKYSPQAVPEVAEFIKVNDIGVESSFDDVVTSDKEYIRTLRDDDGNIIGFIRFIYHNKDARFTFGMAVVTALQLPSQTRLIKTPLPSKGRGRGGV